MITTCPGCEFTLLRYQPDPEDGEFFNVCLLAWDARSRQLLWSTRSSTRRAKRFFGAYDVAAHRRVLSGLERSLTDIRGQIEQMESTEHITLVKIMTAATSSINLPSPPFVWSSTRPVLEGAFIGGGERRDAVRSYFRLMDDKFMGKRKRVFQPDAWNLWRVLYLLTASVLGVQWFGWRFLLFTFLLGVDARLFSDWFTTDNVVEIQAGDRGCAVRESAEEEEEDAVLSQQLIIDEGTDL